MRDLIDRQTAIDTLWEIRREEVINGRRFENHCSLSTAVDVIRDLPSAQPESAQWVQMLINPNLYKCSNCQVAWNKRLVFDNDGYSENIFMKYCPCCGRKMQTEVDYE